MKPYETLNVGGSEYYLKITAAYAVQLEEELGTDLVSGMEKFPEIKILSKYYFAALKLMNDSIKTIEDVYMLFDSYINVGGTLDELQTLMMDVLETSGILAKEVNASQKKMLQTRRETLQKLSEEITTNLLKSVSDQMNSGECLPEK